MFKIIPLTADNEARLKRLLAFLKLKHATKIHINPTISLKISICILSKNTLSITLVSTASLETLVSLPTRGCLVLLLEVSISLYVHVAP